MTDKVDFTDVERPAPPIRGKALEIMIHVAETWAEANLESLLDAKQKKTITARECNNWSAEVREFLETVRNATDFDTARDLTYNFLDDQGMDPDEIWEALIIDYAKALNEEFERYCKE